MKWTIALLAFGVMAVLLALAGSGTLGSSSSNTFSYVGSKVATGGHTRNAPADAAEKPNAPAEALPRKIIMTADLKVIVSDFDTGVQALDQLINEMVVHSKGYLAQREVNDRAGSLRTGHWQVRIVEPQFQQFIHAVIKLGVPELNKIATRDVTAEFYDLEARLANKKREEKETLNYFEKKEVITKMEDIVKIGEQLAKVREQVEVLEGQKRLLKNQIDLTTVNITLQDRTNYVPPQTPDPPSFGSQISGTLGKSFHLLRSAGKGLVLIAVMLVPWLPLLAVVFALGFVGRSRARRWAKAGADESGATTPPRLPN